MRSRFKTLMAGLLLCSAMTAPVHAKAWVDMPAEESRTATNVTKDDTIILRTDTAFTEVRVANPKVADVSILTNKSFHVMGKTSGKTSVMLYDARNQLLEIVDVSVGYDMEGLKKSLYETLPSERIEIRPMAGGIYMSGKVSTSAAADKALQIAQAYAPEKITNGLTVHDSHQVMLEVRFVEASRDVVKELGIGLLTQQAGDLAFQTGSGLLSGRTPAIAGALFGNLDNLSLDASLQALEEKA